MPQPLGSSTLPFRTLALALFAMVIGACASARGPGTELYPMPADLGRAMSPAEADPGRPAELAEAALHLLNPERAGGPDYAGAARMCLLAIDAAEPFGERELRRACHRTAARSALRSGDRELYREAVNRWEREAPRSERAAGELSVHLAIRDRLEGESPGSPGRIPRALRRLLPPLEARR